VLLIWLAASIRRHDRQSLGQVFALGFKHLAAAVLFENYVVGSPE